ncbi:hypothetical protein JJB07_05935 [Tumebacillus sp. ITR2]|uniref:Uncharacterized protein n=1 Tax=Tumebacillus amylolyticus TaxID=2801339 RepID=A0ABS1J7D5_9BACL|nr:hypothetical protein [Tumebacillus amylolyticus]MBL0386191.1 hypothetical protein [Tumebacillus amylolyticus]
MDRDASIQLQSATGTTWIIRSERTHDQKDTQQDFHQIIANLLVEDLVSPYKKAAT